MGDKKKVVVKKKRVVRRKKKPVPKKPNKPTTQRQNQKQQVNQKVVVNVVMPKVASRRKKGYNPPKQVRPSMNKFFGEPSHLRRPASNPYDSMFRNINSPHKEPNPNDSSSLPTADPNAVRSAHENAMPHTVPQGGASTPAMSAVGTNETGSLDTSSSSSLIERAMFPGESPGFATPPQRRTRGLDRKPRKTRQMRNRDIDDEYES
jgi:hypothetical protein